MSLRKPPRRTQAFLEANRANCRNSTGPRTASGKRRASWNAVRHGGRMQAGANCIPFATREAEAFQVFYFTLRDAIRPTSGTVAEERALLRTAVRAWRIRCFFERLTRSLRDKDWRALATGAVCPPNFWRLRIKRPGLVSAPDWTVTISVWLRWGRGPSQRGGRSRPSASEVGPPPHGRRMHTVLSVHSTGPYGPGVGQGPAPARADPRVGDMGAERTKPESGTNQTGYEIMSVPGDCHPGATGGSALIERIIEWLMGRVRRTKPEYYRKEGTYKNISKARGWLCGAVCFLLERVSGRLA